MHPYHAYVRQFASLRTLGAHLPQGQASPPSRPVPSADAPQVMLFSPHPDDECIIGALALRLVRESGYRGVNVAVTLGSNVARRVGRLAELRHACAFLGFELVQTAPDGLERVHRTTREQEPAAWAAMVRGIAALLRERRPRVILFPHDRDWNSTHVGVHWLVADALHTAGPDFECFTVETEFWGQCDDPNAMVEVSETDLADLVAALDQPRTVWIMVPAGDATEAQINELLEHLEPGDTIVDGGNTNFHDDVRRHAALAALDWFSTRARQPVCTLDLRHRRV